MRNKVFGRRSGLRVSELALGTANFGTGWGHGAEREESKRIYDGYLEAGGNFLDTANGYQFGQSEVLLGEFIASERDRLVIATKYTLRTQPQDEGTLKLGNNRKNMVRAVEESLKRLNTDHIDLFWAHISDNVTPMEEILRGFDDLVRAGKIHYAGLSNFPAWRIARADLLAEVRGFAPLVAIQTEYSLAERTADRELLPMAEALGLAATLWSPGRWLPHRQVPQQPGRYPCQQAGDFGSRREKCTGNRRARHPAGGCRRTECHADSHRHRLAAGKSPSFDHRADPDPGAAHPRATGWHPGCADGATFGRASGPPGRCQRDCAGCAPRDDRRALPAIRR